MSFRRAAHAALAGRSRAYWFLVTITIILAALSASCGNSSHSSASHNAYVTFPTQGSVALLHLNDSSGILSLGAQTPSVLGLSPTDLVLDSGKRFLYVGNADSNAKSVTIFTVAGDGTLTQSGDATAIGASPRAMTIDASGKYLLITTDFAINNLLVFSLDSSTGAMTPVGNFAANSSPNDLKISPTSNFVYISNSDAALITAFSLDSATGNLTPVPGSPFPGGQGVAGLAIDPGSHYLYAANTTDSTISAFAINATTGALSVVPGSPFGLGTATAPRAIAIDPSGAFLYVANQLSNNVSAFTITAGTGQLTSITGSPFSAGTQPLFVLAEPAGSFIYVGNQGSTNVSGYSYDSTTGVLTAISGSPFTIGSAPGAMIITH
jgi:6-phosphogluconolactonase